MAASLAPGASVSVVARRYDVNSNFPPRLSFWEKPRHLALLTAAVLVTSAAVGGVLGFELGRHAPPAPLLIVRPEPAKP